MGFWSNLSKSWDQFLEFQPDDYQREIALLDEYQLRARHKQIQRKMVGGATGAGLSLFAVPATGGLSFVFAGIAARRCEVNAQRRDIIEARLREMGWQGYDFGLGDVAWGVAPAGLAHFLVPGADSLFDEAVSHTAAQIATHHNPGDLLYQAALHELPNGAGHYGDNLVDRVANHVQHMAGDHGAGADILIGSTNPATVQDMKEMDYEMGHTRIERLAESVGTWVTHEGVGKVVEKTTDFVVEKVSDLITPQHAPSSSTDVKVLDRPVQLQGGTTHHQADQPELPLELPLPSSQLLITTKDGAFTMDLKNVDFSSPGSKPVLTKPSTVAREAGKQSAIRRISAALLPSLAYLLFGKRAFWAACICGFALALRPGSRISSSVLMVPALIIMLSSSDYLWVVSISLALIGILRGSAILTVVKDVFLMIGKCIFIFVICFSIGLMIASYSSYDLSQRRLESST
jgi:hypothetical protein